MLRARGACATRRIILLVSTAALAVGCSTQGDLPLATQRRLDEAAPPQSAAIIVAQGDTLHKIAQQYRVPLRDLLEANPDLSPPYVVQVGRRLIVPAPRFYEVRSGDTLYDVSRRFQADMTALARENNLVFPYALTPGTTIRLPAARAPLSAPPPAARLAAAASRQQGAAVPQPTPPQPATPLPIPPQPTTIAPVRQAANAGVVGRGPRAADQEGKQGIEMESLPPLPTTPSAPPQSAAPSSSPNPSDRRAASGSSLSPAASPSLSTTTPTTAPPPVAPSTAPPTLSPSALAMAAPPAVKPQPAPPSASRPAGRESAGGGGRFLWPVRGAILSGYGDKPGGERNDGVNIAAAQGTPVAAADTGTVVYAGNQLKSFGNLVLIRHDGDWITVYGHLDAIAVQKDQKVTRGQPIGTVGQTGNVRAPQLHFAVRKGEEVINPMERLER
jgi:murein DD-endopeptidase MepM/ murein hydrolase activator NlpD